MSDKPRLSNRLQFVIGALISIALLSSYLVSSNDKEEKSPVVESRLRDVSSEKQD
jgi:hypothetical protein